MYNNNSYIHKYFDKKNKDKSKNKTSIGENRKSSHNDKKR